MTGPSPAPLAEKADIVRGVTFSKADAVGEPRDGYSPVLRAGNIQGQLILDHGLVFVPENKISEKQRLRCGDIVMCTSSGSTEIVGKTAYSEKDWDGSFGAFCAVVRPKEGQCHPRYLFHYLQSPKFRNWTRNSSGAGIKNIRKSELDAVEIPFPNIDEQRRIARILDKAEAIRRKREQALELADEFLKSVFLDMFGDPLLNPKNWPVQPMNSYLEELRYGTSTKSYATAAKGSTPVLRIPNVMDESINWAGLKFASLNEKEVERLRLRSGDILFVRTNGNPLFIGRCAVFNDTRNATFASYLIRARLSDVAKVLPEFLAACLSMPSYRSRLVKVATTTAGNYNINTKNLGGLPIIEPPLQIQQKFVGVTKALHDHVTRLEVAASNDEQLFSSLSQDAFRGEL